MDVIQQRIRESIEVKELIFTNQSLINRISEVSKVIIKSFEAGNKVFFCGNGGSAADAQHLAAELSGRYYLDRKPLPAEALHVNTSYLTAVANDYSFDEIYARYLNGMGSPGDVLVGLSTSGNSPNIVEVAKTAKDKDICVIALTGITGGKLSEYADYLLNVASTDTPRIQEAHILLGHIICEIVESTIFGKNDH